MRIISDRPAESRHPTDLEISYLVDDEMPAPDARSLRRHISGCRVCADRIRSFERIGRIARSLYKDLDTGTRPSSG